MEPTSKGDSIDLAEAVASGFEPGPLPPMADGAFVAEPPKPMRRLDPDRWVCLKGPCRHYFRIEHTIDSEIPMEVDDKGKPTGAAAATYGDGTPVKVHNSIGHWCFPRPGIEMSMQDEQVESCNWWDPIDPWDKESLARELRRARYRLRVLQESEVGKMAEAISSGELERAGLATKFLEDMVKGTLDPVKAAAVMRQLELGDTIDDPDTKPETPAARRGPRPKK